MAAQIWERVITADVPDEPNGDARGIADWFNGDVPSVATNEPVDDVIIAARVGPIDGPDNILASAGPKFLRNANGLPVSGVMNFDVEDVQSQIDAGTFLSVILHEMGHVLGIGTLWPTTFFNNCAGICAPGGTGATYVDGSTGVCFAALKAAELGLVAPLALEQDGGGGTACGHFDELQLCNELMTGFTNDGANILSIITIGALQDLGYEVDYGQGQSFNPNSCPPNIIKGSKNTWGKTTNGASIERPVPVVLRGRAGIANLQK